MKSPEWLLGFYATRAARTASMATTFAVTGDVPMALQNFDQAVKNHHYRALIGWRTGLSSPVADLDHMRGISLQALDFIATHDVGPYRDMFDPTLGALACCILGRDEPTITTAAELLATTTVPTARTIDHVLDAWFVAGLAGRDVGDARSLLATVGGRALTRTLAATYGTYLDLLELDPAAIDAAVELTGSAVRLFERRRTDRYFADGIGFDGGGDFNDLVVDYHLAAIWRQRGWSPLALEPPDRIHVTWES